MSANKEIDDAQTGIYHHSACRGRRISGVASGQTRIARTRNHRVRKPRDRTIFRKTQWRLCRLGSMRDLPRRTTEEFRAHHHGQRHGPSKSAEDARGCEVLSWPGQGPRRCRRRQGHDSCPLHRGFAKHLSKNKIGLPLLSLQRQPDVLAREPARVASHGLRGLS